MDSIVRYDFSERLKIKARTPNTSICWEKGNQFIHLFKRYPAWLRYVTLTNQSLRLIHI